MRTWAIVFFLLFLVPPAHAQAAPSSGTPPAVDILSDNPGDVHVRSQGQDQNAPARFQPLDLISASAQEAPETFTFTVKVAALTANDAAIAEDGLYLVHFRHQDVDYAVAMYRYVGNGEFLYGELRRYQPDGQTFSYLGYVQVTEDAAGGTLSATVTRTDIPDSNGAAPFPGRALKNVWAESHSPQYDGGFINFGVAAVGWPLDATDRMPDTATGKDIPVTLGIKQEGHALLLSDDPMRASNGEATTFVFTATAKNLGDAEDLFQMVATAAPQGWSVTVPDEYVRLKAGESRSVPVLASVPFYHVHGDVKRFVLEMHSTTDAASIGRVSLGVSYFAIPQPAGHHNQLWFHSQTYGTPDATLQNTFGMLFSGNTGYATMNALDQDANDKKVDLTGQWWGYYCDQGCSNTDQPRSVWRWFVPLSPGLQMGLDFDLSKTGVLHVPIKASVLLPQAQLAADLYHEAYDAKADKWNTTLIAHLGASDLVDISTGDTHAFDLTLTPNKKADLLPYSKQAGLYLEINLTSVRPSMFDGPEAAVLTPGGTMTLPLIEYNDPLGDAFAAASAVTLNAMGDLNKPVNPGRTVLFRATLINGLPRDATFGLSVEGVNRNWVDILTPGPIPLAAGSSSAVSIAVHVPDTATPLDAGDFVLTAQDSSNATQRALVHFVAHVDKEHDVPDEAAAVDTLRSQAPTHKSPMPVAPLVGLLLVACAAMLRRRTPLA